MVAIKGNFMLGLNLIIVNLYPMRVGATMMNSMLVNTALILMMSCAVIQFCAQAFADYASSTAIFDIFGNQVSKMVALMQVDSTSPPSAHHATSVVTVFLNCPRSTPSTDNVPVVAASTATTAAS